MSLPAPEAGASAAAPGTLPSGAPLGLLDLVLPLAQGWRRLLLVPIAVTALALGLAWLIPPTFTARTVFLPPQQQGNAAAALSGLGALGSVAAGAVGLKTTADQYASLLQSTVLVDRLIDRFKLQQVYEVELRDEARERLAQRVRVVVGKKDGLITVEVDDRSPQRAAEIANQHIEELRRLSATLALTEAQQRRHFFETQVAQARKALNEAQRALEGSGFAAGALRAEPRAAAEAYARLRAEVTSTEVRLQTLRRTLTDTAPEVQQMLTTLGALRSQLAAQETPQSGPGPDYLGKYRDFKYQETLFDMFSRQYELARMDEGREAGLIQVIDAAQPPERKSAPRRALIALLAGAAAFLALALQMMLSRAWQAAALDPASAGKVAQIRAALGRGR